MVKGNILSPFLLSGGTHLIPLMRGAATHPAHPHLRLPIPTFIQI